MSLPVHEWFAGPAGSLPVQPRSSSSLPVQQQVCRSGRKFAGLAAVCRSGGYIAYLNTCSSLLVFDFLLFLLIVLLRLVVPSGLSGIGVGLCLLALLAATNRRSTIKESLQKGAARMLGCARDLGKPILGL